MNNYLGIAETNLANVGELNHDSHDCETLASYALDDFQDILTSAIELLNTIDPIGNDALLHLQVMKKEITNNPIYLSVLTRLIKAQRLDSIL